MRRYGSHCSRTANNRVCPTPQARYTRSAVGYWYHHRLRLPCHLILRYLRLHKRAVPGKSLPVAVHRIEFDSLELGCTVQPGGRAIGGKSAPGKLSRLRDYFTTEGASEEE